MPEVLTKMVLPILALDMALATTWLEAAVVPGLPAAAWVSDGDDLAPEAFGVDEPQAAAMRATTATAATAATDRVAPRRSPGRVCA